MNNLIKVETFSDGELVVDSRLVADRLEIEHRSFLDTLLAYRSVIEEEFGVLRFETPKPQPASVGGRPTRFAWLTEDQAAIAATFSRNTKPVVQFKVNLVKAFKLKRLESGGDRITQLEQRLSTLEAQMVAVKPKQLPPVRVQLAEMFDDIGLEPADATLPIKEIWQLIERYYITNGILQLKRGDRHWHAEDYCIKGANQVYDAARIVFPEVKRVHIGCNRMGIHGLGVKF